MGFIEQFLIGVALKCPAPQAAERIGPLYAFFILPDKGFMKPFILSFIALLPSMSWASETCTHDERSFRCVTYVRNYDADTITVVVPGAHPLFGQNIPVRVLGIDTPEIKTKDSCEKQKAKEAKELVASMLKKAKRIDLEKIQRDKYFRILADVRVDRVSLGETLLSKGLAYPYDGGTKRSINWCKSTREIASENAANPSNK